MNDYSYEGYKSNQNKIVRYGALSGLLILLSIILIVFHSIIMGALILGALFSEGDFVFLTLTFVVMLIFDGFIAFLGIKNLILSTRYSKINKEISKYGRVNLFALAKTLKMEVLTLATSLSFMMSKNMCQKAEIDLSRKELVVNKNSEQQPLSKDEYKTVLEKREYKNSMAGVLCAVSAAVCLFCLGGIEIANLIITAGTGFLMYHVLSYAFPPKVELKLKPRNLEQVMDVGSGNDELDELLRNANGYMAELTRLDIAIDSERVGANIKEMLKVSKEIFEFIKKNPDKIRNARQFMNYYLPTAISLLVNYEYLCAQSHKGENIISSMRKIEGIMDSMKNTFAKELDNLFSDKAIDISADINVLEQMIKDEGLKNDPFSR